MERDNLASAPGFGHLLVATDFSANADVALSWARAIATRDDARLTLVHARSAAESATTVERLERRRRQASRAGTEIDVLHHRGHPWRVIAEAQHAVRPDLVVIGSRGHSPYPDAPLGRTADRVLRTLSGAVLTVHPDDAGGESSLATVLAATDFSPDGTEAVTQALRLLGSGGRDRRLVLVHAASEGDLGPARSRLGALAERLRGPDLTVDVAVDAGYAATVIERVGRAIGADVVVLGALGRSELGPPMLGSIAERVLHHATCPVLTTRGRLAAAEATGVRPLRRLSAPPARSAIGRRPQGLRKGV